MIRNAKGDPPLRAGMREVGIGAEKRADETSRGLKAGSYIKSLGENGVRNGDTLHHDCDARA